MPPMHQAAVLEITVAGLSSATSNLAAQTTVPSPRPVGVSPFRGKTPDAEMYVQDVLNVVKLSLVIYVRKRRPGGNQPRKLLTRDAGASGKSKSRSPLGWEAVH